MPLPLLSTVGPLAKMIGGIVDKAIPDKDMKEKLKHELNTQLINGEHEELIAKSSIIKAEADSKHWLTAMAASLLCGFVLLLSLTIILLLLSLMLYSVQVFR